MIRGYPGSKGASGVAQKIISLMPKHDHYIEAFLGSGVIARTKRPARVNTAIEMDASVLY